MTAALHAPSATRVCARAARYRGSFNGTSLRLLDNTLTARQVRGQPSRRRRELRRRRRCPTLRSCSTPCPSGRRRRGRSAALVPKGVGAVLAEQRTVPGLWRRPPALPSTRCACGAPGGGGRVARSAAAADAALDQHARHRAATATWVQRARDTRRRVAISSSALGSSSVEDRASRLNGGGPQPRGDAPGTQAQAGRTVEGRAITSLLRGDARASPRFPRRHPRGGSSPHHRARLGPKRLAARDRWDLCRRMYSVSGGAGYMIAITCDGVRRGVDPRAHRLHDRRGRPRSSTSLPPRGPGGGVSILRAHRARKWSLFGRRSASRRRSTFFTEPHDAPCCCRRCFGSQAADGGVRHPLRRGADAAQPRRRRRAQVERGRFRATATSHVRRREHLDLRRRTLLQNLGEPAPWVARVTLESP